MLIKMLKDAHGASDGYTVKRYLKGEEYDVSEALANCFIADGEAEPVEGEKAEKAPKNKAEKALKNKAE